MNVRFLSIELNSFRSIDQAKISLDKQGTVIVKGINEYEDNATSNGSGKSSIFEGIIYALFEETSSGEKDVENRIIGNGFSVKLEFEIDGIQYIIVREGKNGKSTVYLYKDNIDISARTKTDTNKLIVSILGLSKSIFLDSIFLSQNAVTNLASLAPTARRERLEVLTNTDYTINLFKEQVKQQQLIYEAEAVENQKEINRLNGNKEASLRQKQDIQFKINQIKAEIERKKALGNLADIEAEIHQKEISLFDFDQQVDVITINIQEKDKQINDIRNSDEHNIQAKKDYEEIRNTKKDEYNRLNASIQANRLSIHFCEQNKEKIDKDIIAIRESDKCPTCGRKYENANEEHILNLIEDYNKTKLEEDKKIEELKTLIEDQNKTLDIILKEQADISLQIDQVDSLLNESRQKINNIESERISLNKDKDNIYVQKQYVQNEINALQLKKEELLKVENNNLQEYENMIIEIDNNILALDEQIKIHTDEYTVNTALVDTSKHMLQLITKEFRTYLLQNSLKYLNKVLQDYSKQLFSNEGDVIKIEEADTKLDIILGKASYESLSGGERTRVNIALLLAQKSLAQMIGNISCNIIILDEILGYCDGQAETVVIDLITKELDSLESIYMVSHKEIPIGYDTQLIVIKDKTGLSRIKNY